MESIRKTEKNNNMYVYLKEKVDPIMQKLFTSIFVAKPNNLEEFMINYLEEK